MRHRHTEPVHAFGAVGREARIVLADAPRIAQHLREIEVPPPAALLVLAQDRRDVGALRVPPDRVGRYDRVARSLVDGIGQRQRHATYRGFDAVRLTDVFQTLVVVAEPETPFGLDRARRRLVDHLDNALALALGDLGERVLERLGGSRIAVPVKRHVGQAAMRGGWAAAALPCAGAAAHRPATLSPCPRPCCRRHRAGSWHTSDYFGLTVAHRACVFQTLLFRSCEPALRLPRKPPDPFQLGNVIETGRMSLAVSIAHRVNCLRSRAPWFGSGPAEAALARPVRCCFLPVPAWGQAVWKRP